MRVNRGEQIDEDEEAKAREVAEAKAKKELADAVRLAAELRVLNQTSLTKLARDWAVKLFDTSRMSGLEFESWKAEGLDLFGDPAGEAADIAREVVTKPKDGYVTVRGDGKIIARHRGDEFLFTAHPTLPWVDSVSDVEFADLPDAIEADPGDTGFGTGGDPGDDDPSGFLEGMSRTAQSGGSVSPSNIPTAAEAREKFIKRAERVKLSTATRAALGSKADSIAGVLATTDRQIKRGVDVKVGKVAKPFELFSPDNNVPPDPATFGDDGLSTAPEPSPPAPSPKPAAAKPKPDINRKGQMGRKHRPGSAVSLAYNEAFMLKIADGVKGWGVLQWHSTRSDAAVVARLNEMREKLGERGGLVAGTSGHLYRLLGADQFSGYRGLLMKAREHGLGPEAVTITTTGDGAAVARVLVGEGEDGVPPVSLTWRQSGSHRDDGAFKAGEALRARVRAKISEADRQKPEVKDALETGETLANLIPVVDIFWAPLIAAGQTGDPAAAGHELMIEASAEGILGAVEKVGGLYGKTLAEAIKRAGLMPAFKVAKEIGFSWAGDELKDILSNMISETKELDQ